MKTLKITLAVFSGLLMAISFLMNQRDGSSASVFPGLIFGAGLSYAMMKEPDRISGGLYWSAIFFLALLIAAEILWGGPRAGSKIIAALGLLGCFTGFAVIHAKEKKAAVKG